jgi:tRNA dimethylallyltransferase
LQNFNEYDLVVVLGPTASGKTNYACQLAYNHNGEIISADSRQVYKHLNIGTGKDLESYVVNDTPIPYHLIDIIEPSEQFYLYQYQQLLFDSIADIQQRGKLPIVCGGTGLYLNALYTSYKLTAIPENELLRTELLLLTKNQLLQRLQTYPTIHTHHVDTNSAKRIIRGIEVAEYLSHNPLAPKEWEKYKIKWLGINVNKEERNSRISKRLITRIENGLIEEVEHLLKHGITHERLQFLGLEYKFISYYLLGQYNKETFIKNLETAIHQFSKRQMTWFRKMEKEVSIEWVVT